MMHDYEHESVKTGFIQPDWVLMPDVIPDGLMSKNSGRVLHYPGLKEDVYIPRFHPDASIFSEIGYLSRQPSCDGAAPPQLRRTITIRRVKSFLPKR